MRHKHNYVYTGEVIQCKDCGEIFDNRDIPPSRMLGFPVKKTILFVFVVFTVGLFVLDYTGQIDTQATVLLYSAVARDIVDQNEIYNDVSSLDIEKINTHLNKKEIEIKESLEKERILEEARLKQERLEMQIAEAKRIADLEREYELLIFAYTNVERIKHDLPPFDPDKDIDKVARYHSGDMLEKSYFEHESPDGLSPIDRGDAMGVECIKDYGKYYTSGISENISRIEGYKFENVNNNSHVIVDGLMNSTGHREAILNEKFDKLGVGVRMGDRYIYTTQNFC